MPKTKPKGISPKTKGAIKGYVKQGYSANKIQERLKKQGLGIRRKALLSEIRKIKRTKSKTNNQKYTPKKYRKQARRQQEDQSILESILLFIVMHKQRDIGNLTVQCLSFTV